MSRLALLAVLLLMAGMFWLNAGERSLAFAKPWILDAINQPDAPYTISIADVSIHWSSVASLGKIRLKQVTFAKRDGSAFAVFPDVYATIDPIGFLPGHHLLYTVTVTQPRLNLLRNDERIFELGLEDAPERMAISKLVEFFDAERSSAADNKTLDLPFRRLVIKDAKLNFSDMISGTSIVSSDFDFQMRRRGKSYEALMALPFAVNDAPVKITAGFRPLTGSNDHVLSVQLTSIPTTLICVFADCGTRMAFDGPVSGSVGLGVGQDLALHGFHAEVFTPRASLRADEYFPETLNLGKSSVVLEGDLAAQQFSLQRAELTLEDTTVTAQATAHKATDGWFATIEAQCGMLDIRKLYKYWPLIMAPSSRDWVTAKLKSGYAAKGTLHMVLTPEEFAAENFSDAAVLAIADARDITFEYLPGFPLVEKMNGVARFTGTTVKVEGQGGNLLAGSKISNAVLWVPDLNHPNIPMEATVTVDAPAGDAATMLSLKHFTFDDAIGLDPAQIRGQAQATMKLKFHAFSKTPGADPNAINFAAVDYDIVTRLQNVAQSKLYGGYDVQSLNATLNATNASLGVQGALAVGDAGVQDFTLNQKSGEALKLTVKAHPEQQGAVASSGNDFSLEYKAGEVPKLRVRGKRIDATQSYGGAEHGLLKNFPALDVDIEIGELLLSAAMPLHNVVGTLYCTRQRCESADIRAKTALGDIKASIGMLGGMRRFLLTASDAGSFLKALDVTERMTKGSFELRGTYDDKKAPPQFNGRLFIKDFTLKNSQILGRILSIGSLTGLSNALTGDGIAFEKLAANITSQGGIVALDKGAANGTAIGITVSGKVDTNTAGLDLKGVVVPAYALNSILGKIPVIGMLAGGADEGLIAVNYSVTGTYSDAKVGVNPLSALTPGFLRGIFSIFDDKEGDGPERGPENMTPVGENQPRGVYKR